MSDKKPDDNLNAWLAIGKSDPKPKPASALPAASAGQGPTAISGEMLRKMAAINPSLKAGESTGAFVQATKETLRGEATKKEAAPTSDEWQSAKDADHLLQLAFTKFESERRSLESELAILQAKLAGLKDKQLTTLMDRLSALDPNLSSMVTQAALQQNKRFLDGLGFSPQRFIEHLRKKR